MFIQNVNKADICQKGLYIMLSLEFCNIFLKISKFNWPTSLQVLKVSVISYRLK